MVMLFVNHSIWKKITITGKEMELVLSALSLLFHDDYCYHYYVYYYYHNHHHCYTATSLLWYVGHIVHSSV